jgi:hypothetical protein
MNSSGWLAGTSLKIRLALLLLNVSSPDVKRADATHHISQSGVDPP